MRSARESMSAHWVSTRCKRFFRGSGNVRSLSKTVLNLLTAFTLRFFDAQCAQPDPQSKATHHQAAGHDCWSRPCRTSRRPSRLALARARLCRLTALTGAGRPSVDGHALMAQRERYAAPHRNDSADKLAPLSGWSLPAAGCHGLSSKISTETDAVTGIVAGRPL